MRSTALERRTLIEKLLKARTPQDMQEEFGKILKDNPAIRAPLEEAIHIAARHKLALQRHFGAELEKCYARFLRRCLSDRTLTEREKQALHDLKMLFGLNDRKVQQIHDKVSRAIYRKKVDEVLADKKVGAGERTFLKTLQKELKIPDRIAESIYRDEATRFFQQAFLRVLSDERLSPKEEEELSAIARSLGATVEYNDKSREVLEKYRLYWLIENGDLPAIRTEVRMQKGERCYFAGDATWFEWSRAPKSARFSRPVWNHNDEAADQILRSTIPEMSELDRGKVYLTNRRVLFRGKKNKRSIPLVRIVDFIPMENGVHIRRKGGENPFMRLDLAVDVFSLLLARLLRESA